MRKYWLALCSWAVFACGIAGTSAFFYKLLFPHILSRFFGIGFPPKDGFSRAVHLAALGVVVVFYYVLITRTEVGRKLLRWFLDANKNLFSSSMEK